MIKIFSDHQSFLTLSNLFKSYLFSLKSVFYLLFSINPKTLVGHGLQEVTEAATHRARGNGEEDYGKEKERNFNKDALRLTDSENEEVPLAQVFSSIKKKKTEETSKVQSTEGE